MNHRTWFHLLLRAFGILLIGMGLPRVLNYLGVLLYGIQRRVADPSIAHAPFGPIGWLDAIQLSAEFFQVVFGLYLFFGGKWIVNLAMRLNLGQCQKCGYDLTGVRSVKCPECGATLPADAKRVQTPAAESDV